MEENSLLVDGVRAIGLKFDGSAGFSFADPLAMSLIAAIFQSSGTEAVDQHALKRLCRARAREGHCL